MEMIMEVPDGWDKYISNQELVRCKDCKWWEREADTNYGYCHACKHCHVSNHWDIKIYRTYKDNWYCADGERKDSTKKKQSAIYDEINSGIICDMEPREKFCD